MNKASFAQIQTALRQLIQSIRKAKRQDANLASENNFYSKKVRSELANLRKTFLCLQRDYPRERYPGIAFQILSIEPLIKQIISTYPTGYDSITKLTGEIQFKIESDLAAEIDSCESEKEFIPNPNYLPNDIIEERFPVLKKVLWEIIRCYDAACYNACAVMIRRLAENLIIEAYIKKGIEDRIKKNGDYVQFSSLIGIICSENKLGLTRNTKKAFPDLKIFGDIGAHNRNVVVRKEDLDRLHNSIRIIIEELSRCV